MSIQTEIKAWLDDLGFTYNFSEFEEMCREVELIGAEGMINEYSYETHDIDAEDKARLRKSIFAIYWVSESWDDDPDVALQWLAAAFYEFFAVRGAREAYGFSYRNIYEFVNFASWLAHQEGQCLSSDVADGYTRTGDIAHFIADQGENLNDGLLVSKKVREAGCSCVFDTYGDQNTALTFIGLLLTYSPDAGKELPTVEHVIEELRQSSNRKLSLLSPDDIIYSKLKSGAEAGVDLRSTAFDLSVWQDCEEALKIFEEAVNQILQEENEKAKLEFRKSKLETFKVLDLDEFEADLET